jgi:hypothetical protein
VKSNKLPDSLTELLQAEGKTPSFVINQNIHYTWNEEESPE